MKAILQHRQGHGDYLYLQDNDLIELGSFYEFVSDHGPHQVGDHFRVLDAVDAAGDPVVFERYVASDRDVTTADEGEWEQVGHPFDVADLDNAVCEIIHINESDTRIGDGWRIVAATDAHAD